MRSTTRIFLALLASPVLAHAQAPASPPPAKAPAAGGSPATPTARKTVAQTGLSFGAEDQKLLGAYRLNPGLLEKFETATKKVTEAAKRDPSLKAQFDSAGSAAKGQTLAEGIRRIESGSPAFVALLKEAGTTPRDYVLTSFSLVTATMGSFIRQSNPDSAMPAYIPSENITFFEANRTRIENDFRTYQGQGR